MLVVSSHLLIKLEGEGEGEGYILQDMRLGSVPNPNPKLVNQFVFCCVSCLVLVEEEEGEEEDDDDEEEEDRDTLY